MAAPIPVSLLDLAHIGEQQSVAQAVSHSQRLAQAAEQHGFNRVWLAEHHGMRGVASAATAVMLAGIGQVTSTIRLGAGGIMLPNHPPMMIAEQFGTLEAMFPGRIDLGLGRAPGTDQATAKALRRDVAGDARRYPQDIAELQGYLGSSEHDQEVIAVPGTNSHVPLWLLGSSLYSARLAASLGLPFAFASHFAPEALQDAISLYRAEFTPSASLKEPYVMAGVMAVVADTHNEAAQRFTSVQQQFANLRRGVNAPLPSPVEDIRLALHENEIRGVNQALRFAAVGTDTQVEETLSDFVAATGVDELIVSTPAHALSANIETLAALGNMRTLFAAPSL
ncbi:LLM class flavin-dependent oxidoreductase [Alteromonas sp. ASW11-19]|uniref:LLM class flavin-dependent oxidoreductase n=1 Tax=Alteromonas salexigens TaxID=2982530 RepID=A0ABT2VN45_9ALTE|nr:LLM class flavin-dependent oxidoreductase [Alteromonas salexigens]MCU7554731.1 LLM class flavin-dependent oxidoreductase [Alteromonas salexigens]